MVAASIILLLSVWLGTCQCHDSVNGGVPTRSSSSLQVANGASAARVDRLLVRLGGRQAPSSGRRWKAVQVQQAGTQGQRVPQAVAAASDLIVPNNGPNDSSDASGSGAAGPGVQIGRRRLSDEWSVLAGLKAAWGEFKGSDSWRSDVACSTLQGITCDTNGTETHVVAISLPAKGLKGPIPSSIGSLLHLTLLDLSGNLLTGPFPPSLGNLTLLTTLNLRGNRLVNGMPPSLSSLLLLTSLDLSYNQLGGSLPSGIGDMRKLVHLNLIGCELSGPVPSGVFTLQSLKTLDLSTNTLSSPIPQSASLPALTYLSLRFNSILGTFPSSLLTISTLKYLDLAYNYDLEGSLPNEVSLMRELSYLNFLQINWTGSIPESIGSLTQLEYLCLFANPRMYGSLPASIGRLQKLTAVTVGYANHIGTIPSSWGQLVNLQYLQVSNTNITGSIPSELVSLTRMTRLSVASNKLTGSLPASLSNLLDLTYISVVSNRLEGSLPSSLSTLKNLVLMLLANNNFSGPLPTWPATIRSLISLTLRENPFYGSMPSQYSVMTQLQTLSVQDCRLSGPFPTFLTSLRQMVTLEIGSNNWTGADTSLLPSDTDLTLIRMDNGNFTGQLPKGDLPNLLSLFVEDNELTGTIPESYFAEKTGLFNLNMSYNSLTGYFPSSVGALTRLTRMDIAGNNFSGYLPAAIGHLTNLVALNFSLPCPPPNSSCVVRQTNTSLFCQSCPLFCATCTKARPTPPAPLALPPPPPDPAAAPPLPSGTGSNNSSSGSGIASSSGLSAGATAGIVIGTAVGLLLIIAALLSWRHYGTSRAQSDIPPLLKTYPLSLLAAATNNWSEEKLIGSGGFGDVFEAEIDGRKYAVKRLHTIVSRHFKREVQAMSSLNHSNLVPLFGVCRESDPSTHILEHILVYELMPGGSIEDMLRRGTTMTAHELMAIIGGIARGLEYMHKKGFIHRDVKPANVLLTMDKEAKLSDFGLVWKDEAPKPAPGDGVQQGGEERTQVLGASLYADPEYIRTGRPTLASDVYSFGVLIQVCISSPDLTLSNTSASSNADVSSTQSLPDKLAACIESGGAGAFRNPNLTGATDPFLLALARISLRMTAGRAAERPSISSVVNELLQQADTLPGPSMENADMPNMSSLMERLEAGHFTPDGTNGSRISGVEPADSSGRLNGSTVL